jgi:hypothetical protein
LRCYLVKLLSEKESEWIWVVCCYDVISSLDDEMSQM